MSTRLDTNSRAATAGAQHARLLLAPICAAVLAACGGGGSSGIATGTLSGTAAVGAALANANVAITDAEKANACVQTTIVTTAVGGFTCSLIPGVKAPFLVVVTDPSGGHAPLVGLAPVAPAAGGSLVVNATPLTTAILGQLAGGDALALVDQRTLIDTAKLDTIKTKVLQQLGSVLTAISAPAGYDPFTTPIVAATGSSAGNTADQLIDLLQISKTNGVTTIATIDNTAAAVPLADATSEAQAVPTPAPAVTTLADALRLLAPALNRCFAVPAARRVVASDTSIPAHLGGPDVTQVAAECEDIVHVDYLHNGYHSGQAFYGLMNDATMDGAVFAATELLQYLPATTPGGAERAIVGMRYVDKNGVAGSVRTVARRFEGSATSSGRGTDWYLYGNQQPIDSAIRPYIRRTEQFAPNPGSGAFASASASRYETGIEIFINKDGPGSAGMRAARVTGPGLPPAGLVYTRPDPSICTVQSWLNIRRKDGLTDPSSANFAADVSNIFKLQRTVGLAGSDATTVRPNPNAGNSNSTQFMAWAHPSDYGAAPGATGYIDFSALKANITYQIEVFYDGESTPRHTITKTMGAPVVPAVNGAGMRWLALTADTLKYLDPASPLGAAQSEITLAWTANPYAETIRSAGIYSFNADGSVNQGLIDAPRGVTSVVGRAPGASAGCAPGTAFPALSADGSSSRTLQLRYRMLDGSYKDATWRYN